jgi:chromosome segregation ATPase
MTDEEIQQMQQELEAVTAELGEMKTRLRERDAIIGPLKEELERVNSQLMEKDTSLEVVGQELAQIRESHSQAVARYREQVLVSNPEVPGDLIKGESISELDTSLESARGVVEQVKAGIAAAAAAARVPAGAPLRTGPGIEAMSPREKIQYALRGR